MRLLLSTAALSVASGGTVVTPSLRASLDTQVHQGPAAAGAECLFVNSFKLGGVSSAKSHDEGAEAVDTGILSCPSSYACVEDLTSSMGGRCVSRSHRDYSGHEELYFDTQVHRSLEACKFVNGTDGTRCSLTKACDGLNASNVPCGSCNGVSACVGMVNVTLAEGSCNGNSACYGAKRTILAEGSCNGYEACKSITGGEPGSAGTNADGYTVVGEGSCVGYKQCLFFQGTIGDRSCIGEKITGKLGYKGYACHAATGIIGNDSCIDYSSCFVYFNSMREANFTVSNNSCKGNSVCSAVGNVAIGDNSCIWFDDTQNNKGYSCYKATSDVGDGSCNGDKSCYGSNELIGDCNCNGYKACYQNNDVRADNCTTSSPTGKPTVIATPAPSSAKPTGQPTTKPTNPTTKPTNNPTKGPTAGPVDVPTTSAPTALSRPSSSPSRTPTASPSTSPTVSPSVSPTVSPTRRPTLSPTDIPSSFPSESPTFITSTSVVLEGNLVLDINCTYISTTLVSSAAVIQSTINETILPTLGPNQVLESINVTKICNSTVQPLTSRRLQDGGASVNFDALLREFCGDNCSSDPKIAQALANITQSVLTNSINGGNFTALMQKIASDVNNTVLANAGVNNVTSESFSSFMVTSSPTSLPTMLPTHAPTRKPVSVITPKPTFAAKSSKTTPKPTTKPTAKPITKPTTKPIASKTVKRQRLV